MAIKSIIAGVSTLAVLGGGALVANAATTTSSAATTQTSSAASTATSSAGVTSAATTAAGDHGGPKTGNGVGKGPNVDRSDMSASQLAQVQKDEANGAPQQDGGPAAAGTTAASK
ncbi:MAG: hypothetical protein LBI43_04070 [Streptococcaceae bacterium]|jgi:hypothetical protein|nr:hypothetical protein [Streptococcaceae bacterium]